MKVAVMVYHQNIDRYKQRWLDRFKNSIDNQTFKDFNIFELDYSDTRKSLFYRENPFRYSKKCNNHIEAMNFLLDEILNRGYDVIFNTNVDDFYELDRFEKQINKLNEGYDLVSSNFRYIQEFGEQDLITRNMIMYQYNDDIEGQLNLNHNVIAHPVIATTSNFWSGSRYNESLIGTEDLDLWQRTIKLKKFTILSDYLLYYRIHENQITAKKQS